METSWLIIAFLVFITLVFIGIAVVFPEVVGIQGKKAKEIEASHRPDDSEKP